MTRKLTDDLKLDVASSLPDNMSGLISPADVRSALEDIIDSIQSAFALLSKPDPTKIPLNTSNVWTPIPGSLFTHHRVANSSELDIYEPDGSIIVKFGEWCHFFSINFGLTIPSNVDVEFSLGQDGAPVGAPIVVTGRSNMEMLVNNQMVSDPPTESAMQILIRTPSGAQTLQMGTLQFLGELFATRRLPHHESLSAPIPAYDFGRSTGRSSHRVGRDRHRSLPNSLRMVL